MPILHSDDNKAELFRDWTPKFHRTLRERILYAIWRVGNEHSLWVRHYTRKWWPKHSDFVNAFHYHWVREFQKPRNGRMLKALIAERKGLIDPPWRR